LFDLIKPTVCRPVRPAEPRSGARHRLAEVGRIMRASRVAYGGHRALMLVLGVLCVAAHRAAAFLPPAAPRRPAQARVFSTTAPDIITSPFENPGAATVSSFDAPRGHVEVGC
jgi:hypothetical protein